MKAPLSWLKEYVDINCTAEELETKLFSCGFEVEETIHFGKNIDKIVTCKILSIEKHPNADKLSVTQVDAGKYGKLQIITAATNIFVGAVVPVALDGATLFNGERIFNGELRGLPSYGMFCSGEELGINDDWYEGASVYGILILDENFPLGEEVKKLLDIEDVIFDINVTANRPDCQSIIGLAREVAAVLDKPFKMPDLTYSVSTEKNTLSEVKVVNNAFDLCPRYMAQYIYDVKTEKSPIWLRRRLFSMGLRSVSNIVDITNYVLLEFGQPMHAFDKNDLNDDTIIVRRAEKGEKIVTLDEKEFSLSNDNLVICDSVKPVCIAGIMGGINSGIKENTNEVVFECARFARDNIRKTSRTIGQRSDASALYEKGISFYTVEVGLKRALNLVDKLGCAKIAQGQYDLINQELKEKEIITTVSKVNEVLGINVDKDTIKSILERLNFKVEINNDALKVVVPLYREDMESYPDIAEEIIRELGYDYITPTLLKTSQITAGGLTYEQNKNAQIKNLLVGYGFYETISYSFVSPTDFSDFGICGGENGNKVVKILNPLSEEISVMRRSLIPSLVKIVANNLNRKNNEGRLFELAKVYTASDDKDTLPSENERLSFAIFGEKEDFFTAKGVIEGVLNVFCNGRKIEYVASNQKYLHPTRSANLVIDGNVIGSFGQLHPVLGDKFGIEKPVYVCEIDYSKLLELFNDKITAKPISKFPSIERDLAIVVDESITWAKIVNAVESINCEYLKDVSLFDIYRSEQLGLNKKSMAFNLTFIAEDRTLNVQEIDDIVKNILEVLKEKVDAELR